MIGLRLPPELTARIDAWAERKELTRSEAIRRMIEQALASDDVANRMRK
jgi:metal-responsive CopG/Arc/MetJ family transcriptional regulator